MTRSSLRTLLRAAALTFALGATMNAAAVESQRLVIYSGGFDAVSQTRAGASNAGYALVQRPVRVSAGEWSIDDLPLALDPSTVQLHGDGVAVRSQRYDFATADHAQLLQRAIGREIGVDQLTATGVREFRGTLVAVGNGLTLRETGGQLRVLSGFSSVTLTDPPGGLVTRPTLRFMLDASGGTRDARLDYATAGLAWRAEYRAVLRGSGANCRMALEGHAMVANRSGVDFNNVALDLVAGEPNRRIDRIAPSGTAMRASAPMEAKMMMADAAPQAVASGENHRYRLPGTGDLPDDSLQRLPLMAPANDVPCERRLVAERHDGDWMPERPMIHRELGGDGEIPVRARLVFQNERSAGLGVPLPAGRLRAFDGADLLGEADLGHTAAGRTLDLDLGGAFDVTAQRKTTDFQLDRSGRTMTETVEWTLRNAKATETTVRLGDRLPRWTEWQLVEGGERFRKKDAQRIEADVRVPAGGETVLRYTVRYRWAADITLD
ncbi:MAG TPA: hypothetical protein DCM32_06870 [Xanthomonadaceae bacterium]|jgi:hypothetical protein|nr:hypothetical protein [Xanthomonadaceae bacterium]